MSFNRKVNSLSSQLQELESQIKMVQTGNSADWGLITNKPTSFQPRAHNHTIFDVANLQPILDGIGQLTLLSTSDKTNLVNAINELKGLIGSGGDMPLLVVEDEWEGSTNVTKTFSVNCMGFSIVNEGTTTVTVNIGGKTIQIDGGESFTNVFKPFNTLSIVANGSYKALVTAPYNTIVTPNPSPPNPSDTTAPTVTAYPTSGTYTSTQSVTLSADESATIYYTTDGTTPSTSSAVYSSPISVSATMTLKFFGKDTAGNSSLVQTATYTIQSSGGVTVASDNFDRADAASLGTSPTGQLWSSGLQVISNQTGSSSNLTAGSAWNTMETTKADNIEISLDIIVPTGSTFSSIASGIVFRFKDTSNMYAFGAKGYNSIGIYQAGATGVTIPANKTLDMIGTHTLKVKLMGQTVECYVDNVLHFTITDTVHTANTKHGIALYNTNSPKIDNFLIKTI